MGHNAQLTELPLGTSHLEPKLPGNLQSESWEGGGIRAAPVAGQTVGEAAGLGEPPSGTQGAWEAAGQPEGATQAGVGGEGCAKGLPQLCCTCTRLSSRTQRTRS